MQKACKATKAFFEGWYFKHQSATDTLAIIPGRSQSDAFIQVITDTASYNLPYALAEYERQPETVRIGSSIFSLRRCMLDIEREGISLHGQIDYRNITFPRGDIMGLFRHLPMECRHGLLSLRHELSGSVTLNGREINFAGGVGYVEKDSGTSFPTRYIWVQSTDFPVPCCVTLAVAEIPLMGIRFRGVICAVWFNGVEYRLATYNGARALECTRERVTLQRGRQRLEVSILEPNNRLPLLAPVLGGMSRTIHESPASPARFRFFHDGKLLFDMESLRTGVEFCEQ